MYTSFTVAKQRVAKELTELQTPDTTAGTIVKVTLNQPQQRGHTTQQSGDLLNAQYGAQTTYYPSPQTFATVSEKRERERERERERARSERKERGE